MASAIDVSDMYPVHNAFRDTLSAAPRLIGSIPEGDQARRELVGNFYRNIIAFLEVHHHGEWPRRPLASAVWSAEQTRATSTWTRLRL